MKNSSTNRPPSQGQGQGQGPRRSRKRRGSGGGNNNYNRDNNGGGRNSSSRNSGSRSSSGPRSTSGGRAKKPLTWWEKIVAFFTGDSYGTRSNTPTARSNTSRITKGSADSASSSSSSRGASSAKPRGEKSAPAKSKRKPEMVEVTSPRLYVGNLNFDASENDLMELFNGVGNVQNAEVVSNPYTHRSKGFAFVQMNTTDEAKRAVEELHNKDFMGRPLVVSGAKSPKNQGDNNEEE